MTTPSASNKIIRLLAMLIPDIRDVLVFGGIVLFSYGASLIYQPSGFVVAGLALFWLGVRR